MVHLLCIMYIGIHASHLTMQLICKAQVCWVNLHHYIRQIQIQIQMCWQIFMFRGACGQNFRIFLGFCPNRPIPARDAKCNSNSTDAKFGHWTHVLFKLVSIMTGEAFLPIYIVYCTTIMTALTTRINVKVTFGK